MHPGFSCFFRPSYLTGVSIKWDLIPNRESLGFQFLGPGTLLEPSWILAGTALELSWNLPGILLFLEHC